MADNIKLVRLAKTLLGLTTGAWLTTLVADPCIYVSVGEDNSEGWVFTVPHYDLGTFGYTFYPFLVVLFLTLPTGLFGHAVLYALGLRKVRFYLAFAALAGIALAFMMHMNAENPVLLAFYAAWAIACALIAWLIRRPDKDMATV